MIQFDHIAWSAGNFHLENISFTIPTGKYGVLMGRTGSGKTSLLEILCGLRCPRAGRVLINDQDVTSLPPGARGLGYVPQDGALFPSMRVEDQLGFGLRLQKVSPDERRHRVEALAAQLNIRHLLDRLPGDLSGGEKQRVALGRALAVNPRALVCDEPLSALDESTRDEMADLLQQTQRRTRLTVLHITHSQWEAQRLADVVLTLKDGAVQSTASKTVTAD